VRYELRVSRLAARRRLEATLSLDLRSPEAIRRLVEIGAKQTGQAHYPNP
jgi:hypothetical protein